MQETITRENVEGYQCEVIKVTLVSKYISEKIMIMVHDICAKYPNEQYSFSHSQIYVL